MTVIRSKRDISELEFLYTARELQVYTIRKCVNTIPKRYTFFIAQHLADSATAIYVNTKKGNSIYPVNQHEVQIRRDYFLKAYAELQSLVSQIELSYEIIRYDQSVMQEWAALIAKELKLISGMLKKDRERFKNLPDK